MLNENENPSPAAAHDLRDKATRLFTFLKEVCRRRGHRLASGRPEGALGARWLASPFHPHEWLVRAREHPAQGDSRTLRPLKILDYSRHG